ncbi:temptin-like [Littorina saxatilis]|uniref:Temptin Cys/Cys disulfide domain-containing protein n=1 Tax=Littorina saxatilis TaxID=31220 RepID=A0AAN9BN98_9CAEN
MYRVVLLVLVAATTVLSYPKFKDAIPNGHVVPNPCYGNPGQDMVWGGVGHKNISGGGDLNPFGDTFKADNFTYTMTVCQADSDGDGLTNGQELGDPTCVWTVGAITTNGPRGHPGICEPVGSQWCKNSWFKC